MAELNLPPLSVFLLALARCAGLVCVAPPLRLSGMTLRTRLLLAVVLAALVVPLHSGTTHIPLDARLLPLLAAQAVLGAVLGLGTLVPIAAAQGAGALLSSLAGISLAETYDPQNPAATPLERLMYLLAVGTFFAVGGHRLLVGSLLESFSVFPPDQVPWIRPAGELAALLTHQCTALALQLALPVVAALLVVVLATALIGRVLPQLHLFSVGLGGNVLAGLGTLMIALGGVAWLLGEQTPWWTSELVHWIAEKPPGR